MGCSARTARRPETRPRGGPRSRAPRSRTAGASRSPRADRASGAARASAPRTAPPRSGARTNPLRSWRASAVLLRATARRSSCLVLLEVVLVILVRHQLVERGGIVGADANHPAFAVGRLVHQCRVGSERFVHGH